MWYVIQTKSGKENELKTYMDSTIGPSVYDRCYVPVYEEVRKRSYGTRIVFRKLFPGYLFVETDEPDKLYQELKSVPKFTRLLGVEKEDSGAAFFPVEKNDVEFLDSILEDGIMHVSYVHLSKTHRIDKVIGPLSKYRNHIVKMEYRHRYAIVAMDVFGKSRRIEFGLWGEGDPALPYLDEHMDLTDEPAYDAASGMDIGIHAGDKVIDETGVYGDYVFTVDSVDESHRMVRAKIDIFGGLRNIMLFADDLRVIQP